MQVGSPHHFVRNEPTAAVPARGSAGSPVASGRAGRTAGTPVGSTGAPAIRGGRVA